MEVCILVQILSSRLVIFWNFTVFWHRFHLILATPNLISSMTNMVYELPWNKENLKLEWRSGFFLLGDVGESSPHHPSRYQTFLVLSNFTGFSILFQIFCLGLQFNNLLNNLVKIFQILLTIRNQIVWFFLTFEIFE